MIDMQPVKSSSIKEIGYDPKERTLAVAFSDGSLYHYADVDRSTFDELAGAKSVGGYLHSGIIGVYKHTKMPSD